MNVDIQYRPAYALALVSLDRGESIQVEAGGMVSMSDGLELRTEATGGLLKSLSRSLLGRESFFMNTYEARTSDQTLSVAPPLPGDIQVVEMTGQTLLVQSGSYLASSSGISVDTKWTGARTFFGSEGLIMLRVSGTGTLLLTSYGAVHPLTLAAGERHIVDTGHLVSFDASVGFKTRKVAGWKSTLFSGEGLVVELTGPGKVTIQSRSQDAFLSWLIPKLPRPSSRE